MAVTPSFWQGRRVFLTGHTGFKGSWLSLWLQELGAELTGYALPPPTTPSLFELANVGPGMQSEIADIRDGVALAAAMARARPEIVIHMAAQPLVRRSYADPVETYATNIMGTVHLLEAVRKTDSVAAVVNVTSDKCYENREWLWGYRENEAMGGHDPYSSSKGCAELVTAAYRESFFNAGRGGRRVAIASARAGNVIGGGDWAPDRLMPDMVRAASAGETVKIRHPDAVRPWQHVLEPLAGYLTLAEHLFLGDGEFAEPWNFGPADSDARPVQWIVEAFVARWGREAHWELERATQPHEAGYLKLDSAKAVARLGWQPRWSLAQAIEAVVAWHKDHLAGKDMQAATRAQIRQYVEDGA